MVSEGRGRLFRRTDGKYLIYLPVYLCEDSMFPFKGDYGKGNRGGGSGSVLVHVSFPLDGTKRIDIRPWTPEDEAERTHHRTQDIEE